MTATAPELTKEQLVARRKQVRQQQFHRDLKNLWRYSFLLGLVGASFWLGREPLWALRQTDQVVIKGARALSLPQLRQQLALPLPVRIFEVEPNLLVQRLLADSLIQDARVTRQLWPPRIEVEVQERTPVALATLKGVSGVIDAQGVWLDLRQYPALTRPSLTVVGYQRDQQLRWQELYPILARSAVSIHKVNLENPRNLMLLTDLGVVQLGHPDLQTLQEQLLTLDRLRNLSRCPPQDATHCLPRDRIAVIDLTSPVAPRIRKLLPPPLPTPIN